LLFDDPSTYSLKNSSVAGAADTGDAAPRAANGSVHAINAARIGRRFDGSDRNIVRSSRLWVLLSTRTLGGRLSDEQASHVKGKQPPDELSEGCGRAP